MILLDYKDRRPLYEQIVDKFSDMILKGILKPDEKLPSVRNLAMELSINPNTIQRAYMELEHRGFLYSVKGRGNFVCDNDCLKEERKQEIKARIMEQLKEAYGHGVSRDEIVQLMEQVYGEESQKDGSMKAEDSRKDTAYQKADAREHAAYQKADAREHAAYQKADTREHTAEQKADAGEHTAEQKADAGEHIATHEGGDGHD